MSTFIISNKNHPDDQAFYRNDSGYVVEVNDSFRVVFDVENTTGKVPTNLTVGYYPWGRAYRKGEKGE
jgi:hypothetical protein